LTISHKGAGEYAPENTVKAIRKAIDFEADFVEFDIHITKDNKIVLIHDANTYKTTGVHGIIKNMTLQEIQKLDAGDGEKIPTLDEVILVTKNKINLQIEIKAEHLINSLVKLLHQENLIESSIISSFSITELIKLKKKEPKLKIGYLLPEGMKSKEFVKRNILKAAKNHFYAIHPHFSIINKEIIDYSKNNKLMVNVWTVNDESNINKMINLGVNGIITDEITLLKNCLKNRSE
ncbi:MAG: glycerophosphodiester phosphodiesterase, partial [Candidatus Thorarchaeota archaeon]